MRFARYLLPCLAAFSTTQLSAAPAPVYPVPTIQIDRQTVIAPIDIQSANVVFEFDVATKKATGRASMTFTMLEDGHPMFDLVPNITSLTLDNESLLLTQLRLQSTPDNATKLRYINASLLKGTQHTATFTYPLPSDAVKFENSGVSFAAFMSDLSTSTNGREFWEQYAPANFEFDQFTQHASIKVTGTNAQHSLYTNATSTQLVDNDWEISFRDTSTASSFYIHLVPSSKFVTQSFTYTGIEAAIPVTVYAKTQSLVNSGIDQIKTSMKMLESTYGAYAHPSLVVYVTGNLFGGGMEYAGATASDVSALNHELAHMWFARGVMPASGNAGWVDEAIATWTDEGFERSSLNNRRPVNMTNWSLYRRDTDDKAYGQGAQFISELDGFFSASGGMRPILRNFFAERKLTVIQTPDFIRSIEAQTNQSVQKYFDRFAYGKDVSVGLEGEQGTNVSKAKKARKNPHAFSKERLREIL